MGICIITVNETSFSLGLRFYFFPLLSCFSGTLRLYHVITQRPQRHQAKAMEKQIAASRSTTSIGRSSWSFPPAPQNVDRDERIQWYPVSDEEKPECSAFNMWNPFKSQILNHQKRTKKAHSDFITPLQVSAVQLLIDLSSMALMTPSLASYGATSDDADWRGSSSLETMVSSLLSLIASVKFYSDSSLFSHPKKNPLGSTR